MKYNRKLSSTKQLISCCRCLHFVVKNSEMIKKQHPLILALPGKQHVYVEIVSVSVASQCLCFCFIYFLKTSLYMS